jgi:hypothetical protein
VKSALALAAGGRRRKRSNVLQLKHGVRYRRNKSNQRREFPEGHETCWTLSFFMNVYYLILMKWESGQSS